MTTMTSTVEAKPNDGLIYAPPGPGSWQHDPAHWPRPVTPWTAETFPAGFVRGFAEGTRRYGLLLSHLEAAVVHGRMYYRAVPAGRPGDPDGTAAEIASRHEASREAFETRKWRRDLELWDSEVKPDSVRRNRRLQSVDVAALSDADLGRHLEACRDNHEEMVYRHHKFNMAAMLPVGDFVARVTEWAGASNGEVLDLLRGASPVSLGIAEAELRAVGAALKEAGVDPQSFGRDLPATCVLERLRSMAGGVGEAVRAYLDASVPHVTGGYDVTDLTVNELPDLILQAFWQAREGTETGGDETAGRIERIRARVPEEHRGEFDELLAEARRVSRLRDERGLFNDLWAAGVARTAILEVGRRLALRGRVDDERLIFHASLEEMRAMLRGDSRPTGLELAGRARGRNAIRPADVPPSLGEEPAPPAPLDGLPPHARRAARALEVVIEEILGSATGANGERVVRGKAASPGVYEGPARVIGGAEDLNNVREGDVLVTTSTSASINVVLPLIRAIVTDRGALLSHAAIVAREYGIPGVVGTRDATRLIGDGARIRVDGGRGTVEVLS